MKIKFNKSLFFIFLCSIVMPIALFSGWREWLGLSKAREEVYEALFNIIVPRVNLEKSVNEGSARRVFEFFPAQSLMPQWYSPTLRTKVRFMDGFIEYAKSRFDSEPTGDRRTLSDFCKIVGMATTYRGYRARSVMGITKEHLIGAGVGVVALPALRALTKGVRILAVFQGSVYSILDRLKNFRRAGEEPGREPPIFGHLREFRINNN